MRDRLSVVVSFLAFQHATLPDALIRATFTDQGPATRSVRVVLLWIQRHTIALVSYNVKQNVCGYEIQKARDFNAAQADK